MGLEELSRYIAKEAERIQADLKDPGAGMEARSESTLSRIERQVSEIRGNTKELIERVPENLSPLLIGIKESVLEIMSSSWKQQSTERARPASLGGNWIMDTIGKLTPQEKKLFKLLSEFFTIESSSSTHCESGMLCSDWGSGRAFSCS